MATFKFQNKYACGAYFNMARDNFHQTMLDILHKVGIESKDSEDQINHVLECILKVQRGESLINETDIQGKDEETAKEIQKQAQQLTKKYSLSNDRQLKFRKLLFKRFPILGPVVADEVRQENKEQAEKIAKMVQEQERTGKNDLQKKKSNVEDSDEYYAQLRDASLEKCLEVLLDFAKCLTDCRDFFTHYEPFNPQEKLEQMLDRQHKVASYLAPIFTASRRINKNRAHLSQVEMEFLTGSERYLKKIVQNDKGEDVTVFREKDDYYFRVFGNSFILYDAATGTYIQKNYDNEAVSVPASEEGHNKTGLSDFGIVYLCSIFISRHYAKVFTELVDLFGNSPYNRTEIDIIKEEKLNTLIPEGKKRFTELKQLLQNSREYRQDTPRNAIMREILSIYRIRIPRGKRFDKQDDKTTVALDILNELRRCPLPVYEHLSLEGQKSFHDEITEQNEQTPEVSERKRSSDRFPYLALRAIDETSIFPQIRFQVQLGSFRYRFYDKDCIDGDKTLRCLSKDINGFGRLSDIERRRKDEWVGQMQKMEYAATLLQDGQTRLDLLRPVEDTIETTPYITDHQASYLIYNNRIGLYWNRNGKQILTGKDRSFLPQLLTGKATDHNGRTVETAPIQQPAPLCTLSIYELPALLFYQHLWKRGMKTTEQIIIDKYESLVRFFTDVSQKGRTMVTSIKTTEALQQKLMQDYHLQLSEIPKKMIIYLSHKFQTKHAEWPAEDQVKERYGRVCRWIKGFSEATKAVGTRENEYGKKKYQDVRHGKLAEQLAESLVLWLPAQSEARSVLTGLNYNKLKSFLATYTGTPGHQQQDLTQLFSKACLTADHPFLQQVLEMGPYNIERLYYLYLNKEKEHLAGFLNFVDPDNKDEWYLKEDTDLKQLPFVRHERLRFGKRDDAYCKDLATRYCQEVKGKAVGIDGKERETISTPTVQLPDGLFTDAIREQLKAMPQLAYLFDEETKQELSDKEKERIYARNHNVAYLIGQYFLNVKGDEPQAFYTGKEERFYRHYELFDVLCKERNGNEFLPAYLSGAQVAEWLQPKEKAKRMTVALHRVVKDSLTKQVKKVVTYKEKDYAAITQENIDSFVKDFINEAAAQAIKDKEQKKSRLSEEEESRIKQNVCDSNQGLDRRIKHLLHDCQKNERELRRFKTQDIVLFLTAKRMLSGIAEDGNADTPTQSHAEDGNADTPTQSHVTVKMNGNTRTCLNRLQLSQVLDGQFLNLPVDYKLPYLVKQPDGQTRQVNITQQQMSIKNFGRLSRVLTDSRLDSLLQLLLEKEQIDKKTLGEAAKSLQDIGFNDLASEFANYDHLRPEAFMLIQLLEKEALKKTGDKESPDSHSFKALVDKLYDSSVADTLNAIRISFAHNRYGVSAKQLLSDTNDGRAESDKKETDLTVPNVSMLMKEKLSVSK